MPETICAQCGTPFAAQAWTRACPSCGAADAARCSECGTPIRVGTRVCEAHAPASWYAAAPAGARAFQRFPDEPMPGVVLPAPAKRRRWPAVLLTLLLLAGIGGGAVVAWDRLRPDYPREWDPRVKDLAAFVERERGLTFEHPVRVDFLADAAFRERVTEREEPSAEERRRLESEEAVLRALGLLSGDSDLLDVGEELVGDGVVGLYSFEDQRILVRGETLDDERRSTLVHELTHALQDQHFDLGGREPEGSGAELALTAVVEADAEAVEEAWVESLPESDRKALEDAQDETAEGADFEGVPPVFVEMLSFPYAFGPIFLDAVVSAKGQAGRDELFRRPPTSEEHIVLPDNYLAGQHVEVVEEPALAAGEKKVEDSEDDMGMVSLLVILGERLDFATAWAAVQGWSGDSSVAFRRGGDTCVRATVAFDAEAQAQAFEAAFVQWAQGFRTTNSRRSRFVTFESCDPGTSGPAGRAEGHVSGVQGLGLRQALIQSTSSFGMPVGTATCVADGVLSRVGADRLARLDADIAANPSGRAAREVAGISAEVTLGCRP